MHAFNKINKKLYMIITNNKYVNFNQRLSREIEINMLFFREIKAEYLFEIRFLKF